MELRDEPTPAPPSTPRGRGIRKSVMLAVAVVERHVVVAAGRDCKLEPGTRVVYHPYGAVDFDDINGDPDLAIMSENADPQFFRNLPKVRPAPRILLGGPGWDREACPDAHFVDDLASTCEEISRAVGL